MPTTQTSPSPSNNCDTITARQPRTQRLLDSAPWQGKQLRLGLLGRRHHAVAAAGAACIAASACWLSVLLLLLLERQQLLPPWKLRCARRACVLHRGACHTTGKAVLLLGREGGLRVQRLRKAQLLLGR